MSLLAQTLSSIEPPDENAAAAVAARLDSLTKPRGSLGYLEEIAQRYAAVRGDPEAKLGEREILVFVADHGVVEQGVSAYPKQVTVEMLRNLARGGAAISVLARRLGLRLELVDVGVEHDTRAEGLPGIVYRRIGAGTRNFAREPAMTPEQARAALEVGIELARGAAARGATLLGIGEMGIGNSTAAAAVLAAATGIAPQLLAGHGAGIDEEGRRRKVAVIREALYLHRAALRDALGILAAVGGFEIGAMAGACLGAAAARIALVVDGFIATAGAALAEKLSPGLCARLFFAHRSADGGHQLVLDHLGAGRPILELGMRLGEGTGAALAMTVIDCALTLLNQMATFSGAGVSERIGPS
jgi:nicotinate-nucleotide--dimethylbenzimidazole phosphoribosyltransferase